MYAMGRSATTVYKQNVQCNVYKSKEQKAHPSRGFDPRVCSIASPPAAGALCTEAAGRETPHELCSKTQIN